VGEQYYGEVWVRRVGSGTIFPRVRLRLAFRSADGATNLGYAYSAYQTVSSTGYVKISVVGTVPAGSGFVVLYLEIPNDGADYSLFVDDVYLRRMVEGSIIVDGTITGTHVAANTITALQIAGNTITAAQIAAGAIGATQIAANAITAGKINAGAINASSLIVDGVIITGKVANNAITVLAHAYTTGTVSLLGKTSNGNYQVVQTVNITTVAGEVYLDVYAIVSLAEDLPVWLRAQRDGGPLFTVNLNLKTGSHIVSFPFVDVVSAGAHTYTFEIQTGSGSTTGSATNRAIRILHRKGK
jgi:hypothetical protein